MWSGVKNSEGVLGLMQVSVHHAKEEVRYGAGIVAGLAEKSTESPLTEGDYLIVSIDDRPLADKRVWMITIEHKNPSELMQSILYTNRHLDQLRRMQEVSDQSVLLICGRVIPNDDGIACEPWRGVGLVPLVTPMDRQNQKENPATITYQRWVSHLWTLRNLMGVRVVEVESQRQAAWEILVLAKWWETAPDLHQSHMGGFKSVNLVPMEDGARPSLVRRVVTEFDGVGMVRAGDVEMQAKEVGASLRGVLGWDKKEWTKVNGIGPKTAQNILNGMEAKIE